MMDFAKAWPLIRAAMRRAGLEGVHRDDVWHGIDTGKYEVFFEGQSVAMGCAAGNAFRVLAAGVLGDMIPLEKRISDFARERGYHRVEFVGRPGWERIFPDYKRAAVILRKEL